MGGAFELRLQILDAILVVEDLVGAFLLHFGDIVDHFDCIETNLLLI